MYRALFIVNLILCVVFCRQVRSSKFQRKVLLTHEPFKMKPLSFTKVQDKQLSKNFYRLYKYIHLQLDVGTRKEEIYKTLYQVVEHRTLKKTLLQMSVIISQHHEVSRGIVYLKKQWKHSEGQIFIGLLESMETSVLNAQTFTRLDHMLFQKYLSQMRYETDKIKRAYGLVVALFTLIISVMLMMPIVHQMMISAKQIFVS